METLLGLVIGVGTLTISLVAVYLLRALDRSRSEVRLALLTPPDEHSGQRFPALPPERSEVLTAAGPSWDDALAVDPYWTVQAALTEAARANFLHQCLLSAVVNAGFGVRGEGMDTRIEKVHDTQLEPKTDA